MPTKSFFEVLEEKIRADLRAELSAEMQSEMAASSPAAAAAPGGYLESWLLANIEKTTFDRKRDAVRAYRVQPKVTTAPPPPRPAEAKRRSAQTAEEQLAHRVLNRESGGRLPELFTEEELKTAWRRAALRTHPDRFAQSDLITQAQMGAIFRETVLAVEILENLFD